MTYAYELAGALNLEHRQSVGTVFVGAGKLLVGFFEAFRADIGADPQPDPEGFAAPGGFVAATRQLGGTHQRCGTLELLGGQQPQRVAHQHGNPVAAIERAASELRTKVIEIAAHLLEASPDDI